MEIDIALAISIFLSCATILVVFAMNYFSQAPTWRVITEYREKAIDLITSISSEGYPTEWEKEGVVPSELGLAINLYKIPILVQENSGYSRVNEPVYVSVRFDPNCENKTWNDTVRLYDENFQEIPIFLWNETFCSSQYLKKAYVSFEVNISAGESKLFLLFYSNDNTVEGPNYTSTLVGYWTFDEGLGTVAYDHSGNENNGVLYNGSVVCSGGDCPNWVDGKFGKALSFDGINDYVNIPDSASLDITDEITIEAWVKPNTGYGSEENGHIDIVSKWGLTGTGNATYMLGVNSSGNVLFYVHDGTSSSTLNSINTILENSWSHIVGVREDSTLKIYINGVLDNSLSNAVAPQVSNYDLAIAQEPVGGNNFNGTIDEVRIYSRALTASEINTTYLSSPLAVTAYPEEQLAALSQRKLNYLRGISYDELRRVLGEDYEFRIEISEAS